MSFVGKINTYKWQFVGLLSKPVGIMGSHISVQVGVECGWCGKWVVGLLNQACRPASTWFLKIDPVRIVGMCVCARPRLLITSGVMWHDMKSI